MPVVGIDLGGTKIMGVLVDDNHVVASAKKATPKAGTPCDVLDAVAAVVVKVDPDATAHAIGVGVPGPVRPGTGVLPIAINLPGWDHDVDVAAALHARCGGRDVVVDNDVNVATLAEVRFGAGKGVADVLGIFMGTGVGAGLVLDGVLRRGPRGFAGEIGHAHVAFHDFGRAEVGGGELEDYAGRRMMERRARARQAAGEETLLVDLAGDGRMKSSIWEAALLENDRVAASIIHEAADALAAAIAGAIALVDIELVVLGGGMAERLGEPFRVDVERRVAERAFGGSGVPVRAAALGDRAGAVGAALLLETTR